MLLVVSDASPLHYLVLIGASELLPVLYGHVVIPDSVAVELNNVRTPEVVKQWIGSHPAL